MAREDKKADEGRRSFLKLAVAAAPAAAATAATGTSAEAAPAEEPQGSGLRKTAHVKAYLDSARF
jgi:nitrous oxide reductase